jgi:hypothetical protein
MNTNLQHRKVAIFRAGLQLFSTRGSKCPTRGWVLAAIISIKAGYLVKVGLQVINISPFQTALTTGQRLCRRAFPVGSLPTPLPTGGAANLAHTNWFAPVLTPQACRTFISKGSTLLLITPL